MSRETILWDMNEINAGSMQFLPNMKTDISLESNNQKIIIDTKFYKDSLMTGQYGNRRIQSGNLYQIVSYLENVKYDQNKSLEGILLYPTVDESLDLKYDYRGKQVSIKTINLNQNWKDLSTDLLNIIA